MKLSGSCHCGNVQFEGESAHPYPFNLCYCSICRKTAGSGGYGINLGGDFRSLRIISGEKEMRLYQAEIANGIGEVTKSPCERRFCGSCGSALWVYDPRWPDLIHPFASAIDTPLPAPPEKVHLMLDSKPAWVFLNLADSDTQFGAYPLESIEDWHKRLGLESLE